MWTDRWTGHTIDSVLRAAVARYGNREAFVFGDVRVSYREVADRADAAARSFLALGVKRGDRVALWMAGYPEWASLYYGLAKIGAIMVPVNTRYRPAELEYVLRQAEVSVLVFRNEVVGSKDYAALLAELCPELATAEYGALCSRRLPELRAVIAIGERGVPGAIPYEEFLRAGATVSDSQLIDSAGRVTSTDLALIQFTSGTTGSPKGAMLFQEAMLRGAYYNSLAMQLTEHDRLFSPQPFYHVGGSIKVMLCPIVIGTVSVVQPYFDPTGALHLMETEQCTATMGHQPHWIEYLSHPDLHYRRLRIEKAASFAPPEVNRRVAQEMGIPWLISPYGMTETHLGGTACQPGDSFERRIATVGCPVPGVEMELRDPTSRTVVPAGQAGEVCFRGWCPMRGYYRDPDRTAQVLDHDGWLHTGDLGVVDADGYLRLVGRIKDMIRVGGENLAAAEVESILLAHSAVKQAVAVGKPDPRLGEVCVAFVELKAGASVSAEALIAYCRDRLASFKVPREIHFMDDWPMSGTGKIQRAALRAWVETSAPDATS